MKNAKLKIKNLLIVSFLVFLFLIPTQIQASSVPYGLSKADPSTPKTDESKPRVGLVPCGPGTAKPVCELCDFFVLFKNIVDFVLWDIVPPLAVLFIAIGGFYFFFTEGNPERVAKGKDIIKKTLIGLVIIFGAWLVVNLFFQIIGVQRWTGLENWWQIPCP